MRFAALVLAGAWALSLLVQLVEGRRWVRVLSVVVGLALSVAYVRAVLRLTVLRAPNAGMVGVEMEPFWSYRSCLELTAGGIRIVQHDVFEQIVLNYVLYVPFGCLLPIVAPGEYGDCGALRGLARVLPLALACAVSAELAQLALRSGLVEFDDVFGNVMGAGIGYGVYRVAGLAAGSLRQRFARVGHRSAACDR